LSEQNLHHKEILEIFWARHCADFILNAFFKHFNITYISRVKIIDTMFQFNVEGYTNFTALLYAMLRLL